MATSLFLSVQQDPLLLFIMQVASGTKGLLRVLVSVE